MTQEFEIRRAAPHDANAIRDVLEQAFAPYRGGYTADAVAKALLAQVEREVRRLQCTAITLDTTRPLERAVRFYERNGFRATGDLSSFFGMDLFTYRKELAE